jgi:hypothetical protein
MTTCKLEMNTLTAELSQTGLYHKPYIVTITIMYPEVRYMREETDLEHLDRVLYQKYLENGLIELFLGFFIISIFIADIINSAFIFALSVPLCVAYGPKLWKKIITPRLGYVKFGGPGSGKMNKLTILLTAIVVVFFLFSIILAVFFNHWIPSDWILQMYVIIIGIVCLTIFSIVGFITGVHRFYFYGTISILLFNIAHLFSISVFLCFGIIGIIILVTGVILLIRFLKDHPVLDLEGEDVGQ